MREKITVHTWRIPESFLASFQYDTDLSAALPFGASSE